MQILGVYKIHYLDYNIIQFKNLISHNDYLTDIKPSYNEIDFYELKKETQALAKAIKKRLRETYGEHWFTDESPLFESAHSGCLKLYNGKEIRVGIDKI